MKAKKVFKYGYWIGVHGLAAVGLVFLGVFVAMRFKLLNEGGTVDKISSEFENNAKVEVISEASTSSGKMNLNDIESQIEQLSKIKDQQLEEKCQLDELSYITPKNVDLILKAKEKNATEIDVRQMIFAVKTHLENITGFNDSVAKCKGEFNQRKITDEDLKQRVNGTAAKNIFDWPNKKEWSDVQDSIIKDRQKIDRAAKEAGINSRLIVSSLMVEQLRLFYSQRELYKKYFEPLKILANSYKISLGVMAIKEETAMRIEEHLKDAASPYYLGQRYKKMLDYPEGVDISKERYNRLTSNDHYWNYLYGALYLKQMMSQWKRAGYDLSNRPEIVGTLFNVGFPQSKPNANPKVGGSKVIIDQTEYSFGRLAYEFYYPGELIDEFPL